MLIQSFSTYTKSNSFFGTPGTFMKRHFGRMDQIWNLKIKLSLQGNPSFALKNPLTNLCSSNLKNHALHRNTIYEQCWLYSEQLTVENDLKCEQEYYTFIWSAAVRYLIYLARLAFCYRGAPPKRLSPLKFSKTIERTIETIAYCFKNNGLLSSPLNFFLAESQKGEPIRSVQYWFSLAK